MAGERKIIETLVVSGKVDSVVPKVAKGKGTIKIVVVVPYEHETWVSLGNIIGQDAGIKLDAYATEEKLTPDEAAKRDTPMLEFDEDLEEDSGGEPVEDDGKIGTPPGVPPRIKASSVPSAGYGEGPTWPEVR